MTRALLASLLCLAACDEQTLDPPWQLDHDRVVAVRVDPPHIAPGEIATFEALIAHADGPTTVAPPVNAAAPFAPGRLFTAVHFYIDHWRVDGPDEAQLDAARAELGLPSGAPVPLDVSLELPGPLFARKTVWLGDTSENPAPPTITHGPVLEAGREYALRYDVAPGWSVRWLTSCGALRDDASPRATHIVDEPCEGELVLVVRDPLGGVGWQILPLRVE